MKGKEEAYFDSKRDNKIIKAGGFFCLGCLIGKEKQTQSKEDPRYCQSCYDFLQEEYRTREFLKEQRKQQDLELREEEKPEEPTKEQEKSVKVKKEKKVKKGEAELFMTKNPKGFTLEKSDGHYTVVEIESGKKFRNVVELPGNTVPANVVVVPNVEEPPTPEVKVAKAGAKRTSVLDTKTGKAYSNRDKAYHGLLDAGELVDFVKAGKFGKDPEHNYGWYVIEKTFPGRFELK
jgi:hypothetical protein